jgi:hypothetical protein
MESQFTYGETLRAAESIRWRVEDLIGEGHRLDFEKAFLPDSLARTAELGFLDPVERRTLNQIRGHAYLAIFGLVEEFILPFVVDHARPRLGGDDHQVRALLQFASEEAKHIHLFRCFRSEFADGFGVSCAVIGPPADIARAVLAHHPLAVALTILHIEWMTQRHWIESVKDASGLDPQFRSLLRHHWMEEAQHAKLDTLMVEALAAASSPDEVDRAVDEYLEIGAFLDAGLGQQTAYDLESFEQASGRRLTGEERARIETIQRQANRWTYLGSGMTHPKFLATLGRLRPGAQARIASVAPAFC